MLRLWARFARFFKNVLARGLSRIFWPAVHVKLFVDFFEGDRILRKSVAKSARIFASNSARQPGIAMQRTSRPTLNTLKPDTATFALQASEQRMHIAMAMRLLLHMTVLRETALLAGWRRTCDWQGRRSGTAAYFSVLDSDSCVDVHQCWYQLLLHDGHLLEYTGTLRQAYDSARIHVNCSAESHPPVNLLPKYPQGTKFKLSE